MNTHNKIMEQTESLLMKSADVINTVTFVIKKDIAKDDDKKDRLTNYQVDSLLTSLDFVALALHGKAFELKQKNR